MLKLLQRAYYGKVKMIYIDPSYNTGKEFIYPDNFREGLASYLRFTGQLGKRIAGADWIRLLSEKWTPHPQKNGPPFGWTVFCLARGGRQEATKTGTPDLAPLFTEDMTTFWTNVLAPNTT